MLTESFICFFLFACTRFSLCFDWLLTSADERHRNGKYKHNSKPKKCHMLLKSTMSSTWRNEIVSDRLETMKNRWDGNNLSLGCDDSRKLTIEEPIFFALIENKKKIEKKNDEWQHCYDSNKMMTLNWKMSRVRMRKCHDFSSRWTISFLFSTSPRDSLSRINCHSKMHEALISSRICSISVTVAAHAAAIS